MLFTVLAASPGCGEELAESDIATLEVDLEDEGEGEDAFELESSVDEVESTTPWLDETGELATLPDTQSAQSCSFDNDCRTSCECNAGTCEPQGGIGPQPPAGYCDLPPTRACSGSLDCRDGCSCSGGTCQPTYGIGPHPACHLPPPDQYESDDTWPNYSAYTGPQRHNFDNVSDSDWVGVHISQAGRVRFETTGLTHGTDTRLEVYAWNGSRGALLGSHDDVGGWYFDPNSKRSIVELDVPGDASYLIRVFNDSNASVFTESHSLPTYTLKLRQL